ncbi:MAG: FHA domain-containing protein [Acidobacteria bacterium]|nr:FHA domain-containing protein [Acidobacteriota bacterium]
MAVMIRCHSCGTDNLDSAQYCDQCGARLAPPVGRTLASASADEILTGSRRADSDSGRRPQKTLGSGEAARPLSARQAQPRQQGAVGSQGSPRARLVVIRSGRLGHEFPLTGTQWLVGRWDPDHGIFPDVDLDVDDLEANVSRRHARIVFQDGQYLIEDLGSTNGTFINRGARLIPGRRYLIQDGDELIVGKTFLKFIVE